MNVEETARSCIVLVHGAWHGGWCWQRVVEPLRAATGEPIWAPTLRGLGDRLDELAASIGLRAHAEDLVQLVQDKDLRDVVLVGHSYAGLVVREAADRCPERVRGIVLVDAWVGRDGESVASLAPDWFMPALTASADADGDGWAIPPPPAELVGVNDPDDAAWLAGMCTPQPLFTFTEATQLRGDIDTIGCEAIVCRDGIGIPFASWADEFGWPTATIDCGHDAMVIEPERLTSLLAGAVRRLRDR
jgi:pimeloyl-ACP methyl ester carboxylesterase